MCGSPNKNGSKSRVGLRDIAPLEHSKCFINFANGAKRRDSVEFWMTKKTSADKAYELQRRKDESSKELGLPSPSFGPVRADQKESKDNERK